MKRILLSVLSIAGVFFFSVNGMAQERTDTSAQHETIILKKDGTFPDNLTIHIQGDKVTINGKTPDDITVTRKKSSDNAIMFKQFHRDAPSNSGQMPFLGMDSGSGNAFLGVLTKRNDSTEGARIVEIEAGTPADSAGLEKGDEIIGVNNHKITSSEDLSNVIASYNPGEKVTIKYLREGEEHSKTITLGRLDNVHNRMMQGTPFGMNMPFNHGRMRQWFFQHHPRIGISPDFRFYNSNGPKLGVVVENNSQPEGAIVVHISPGSAAEKARFKKGDVITSFGGESINDIEDLKESIQDNKGKSSIKAEVERDGKKMTLSVSLEGKKNRASL